MKLLFRCVKCGRMLGTYEGEEFYVAFGSMTNLSNLMHVIEVVCKKCWEGDVHEVQP